MGFLDFLKSRLFGNVGSTKSDGFEDRHIEVEVSNYSNSPKRGSYWKEFYLSDGTHVSRHGSDKDFEKLNNEDMFETEEGFFFMRKREDYEKQDPIFDYDYNDLYYQN